MSLQATNRVLILMRYCMAGLLMACNGQDRDPAQTVQLKPAVKLGTDASGIARLTHQFLISIQTNLVANPPQSFDFEHSVYAPARALMVRWRTEIKQTDSVVGDQYTICYAALVSLDSWARSVQANANNQNKKRAIYLNQKNLCDQIIARQLLGQKNMPQPATNEPR